VVSVVREAVRRGEQGLGPTLIEAVTYRMGGHSTSDDPNRYRPTDDLKPWAERDPLARLRQYLERRKAWDDRAEQALIADIDQRFRAAVAVSEKTPPPPLESIFEDVYQKPPWHLQEQRAELVRGPRAPSSH
jgi:2-oxoisovalerate dehydrogenase E1 component alpha subunit